MKTITALLLLYAGTLLGQTTPAGFNMNAFLKQAGTGKYHKIKKVSPEKLKWDKEEIYGYEEPYPWLSGIFQNDSVKKYITAADIEYMKQQYEQDTIILWTDKELKGFTPIDSIGKARVGERSLRRRRMGNNYYNAFSTPLYNLKGDFLIIKEAFACGIMCADWCTCIYRKNPVTQKWEEFTRFMCFSV